MVPKPGNMTEKVNARDSAGQSIGRLCAKAKAINILSMPQIDTYISQLEKTWDRFCRNHDAVLLVTGKSSIDEQHALFIPIEETYMEAYTIMLNLKEQCVQQSASASVAQSSGARTSVGSQQQQLQQQQLSRAIAQSPLPKISLPQFSEGYVQWQSFSDLYNVLIHNNTTMSKIEKFHYLRASVNGEAERIIGHIGITSDNYLVAYNTFNERYTNIRIVTSKLIDRLINQPVASETVYDIKQLLDTTK